MKKLFVFVSVLMIGALVSNGAMATVPDLIPVQGVLADDAGAPIDGAIDLTFSLYDSETASTPLWTGTFADVDVAEGFFTVYLGSGAALDFSSLIGNTEIWLGMTVEADPEMNRMQLATVPFAVEAQVCQAVGSLTEADINVNFAPTSHTHDGVYATDAHSHDWIDITTGMPAGFADGVDDVDDTVDWTKISGIAGTTSTTVAVGDHNHDADYSDIFHDHDTDYADIAHNHDSAYAPLSHGHAWADITSGVPAGFADGVDNDTDTWLTYTGTAPVTVTGTVISLAADGIGAGLIATGGVATAEILDGTVSSADIAVDTIAAVDIAAGAVTVSELADGATLAEIVDDDGTGSGLDADLLDGQHAAAFAAVAHGHTKAACPDASFTLINLAYTTLCVRQEGWTEDWNAASSYCNSTWGAKLCTHMQLRQMCLSGTAVIANRWMADRLADDNVAITNGTSCDNFDGSATYSASGGGEYCCLEWPKY